MTYTARMSIIRKFYNHLTFLMFSNLHSYCAPFASCTDVSTFVFYRFVASFADVDDDLLDLSAVGRVCVAET